MTTWIEDSPRNLPQWISESVDAGMAAATVITPWATPWRPHTVRGLKPHAARRVGTLRAAGVPVFFDPMTHVLQMAGIGDDRFYNEYPLWGGSRGDLTTPDLREQHVIQVLRVQDALDVPHLAPTELLHTGLSQASSRALDLARRAAAADRSVLLPVAGTTEFWASGSALDAHVGSLASLQPGGWVVTMAHADRTMPATTTAEAVHGLCRTVRALAELGPVHVSHGDFAALPAVAAGASSVGTGWDQRQRSCSYGDYGPRVGGTGFGSWNQRVAIRGLVGSITQNEATVLETRDPALFAALGGGCPPDARSTFNHHLRVLVQLVGGLTRLPDPQDRYQALADLYRVATANWTLVGRHGRFTSSAGDWIRPYADGLALYGATEGW